MCCTLAGMAPERKPGGHGQQKALIPACPACMCVRARVGSPGAAPAGLMWQEGPASLDHGCTAHHMHSTISHCASAHSSVSPPHSRVDTHMTRSFLQTRVLWSSAANNTEKEGEVFGGKDRNFRIFFFFMKKFRKVTLCTKYFPAVPVENRMKNL